jgi:hypothetical protein
MPLCNTVSSTSTSQCENDVRVPSFAHRTKNVDLARLDLDTLRAKAKYYQLDISKLRYKVQFFFRISQDKSRQAL